MCIMLDIASNPNGPPKGVIKIAIHSFTVLRKVRPPFSQPPPVQNKPLRPASGISPTLLLHSGVLDHPEPILLPQERDTHQEVDRDI
jgi:hypothetical protein